VSDSHRNRCSKCPGIVARFRPESLLDYPWNPCSICTGIRSWPCARSKLGRGANSRMPRRGYIPCIVELQVTICRISGFESSVVSPYRAQPACALELRGWWPPLRAMQHAHKLDAFSSRLDAIDHDKGRAANNQLAGALVSPWPAHFRVIDQLAYLVLDSVALLDG